MKFSTKIHLLVATVGAVIAFFGLAISSVAFDPWVYLGVMSVSATMGVGVMTFVPGLADQLKHYDLIDEFQQGSVTFAVALQTELTREHSERARWCLGLAQRDFAAAKAAIAEHPFYPGRALQKLNHARFHLEGLGSLL
ncbi:MAG: hypothetical protein K2W82_17785 [Candidatus Obscuribacterales bacterium]|nr:hypothetical protein [Candidatus Obscuribacterales bacterium]